LLYNCNSKISNKIRERESDLSRQEIYIQNHTHATNDLTLIIKDKIYLEKKNKIVNFLMYVQYEFKSYHKNKSRLIGKFLSLFHLLNSLKEDKIMFRDIDRERERGIIKSKNIEFISVYLFLFIYFCLSLL
jgi:hypothetical protein